MGNEELCLADALETEKVWEEEGVSVLIARICLPQLGGSSRRARRFNRYYRRFCRAYLRYCEQALLPAAAAQCRDALARSALWAPMCVSLRYTVSRCGGGLLSLYTDAREGQGFARPVTVRRADTWDLTVGLPMPLSEFFPRHCRARRRLLDFARAEARRQSEHGAAFYPDCRIALRRALNTRNFYLGADALHFFYPMYTVAPGSEDIVVFDLPYDDEAGPFLPPQG